MKRPLPCLAVVGSVVLVLVTVCTTVAQTPPLFALIETDRKTVYQGERFNILLSIYINGTELDRHIAMAGLPDASRLKIEEFHELASTQQGIEGHPYDVRHFTAVATCSAAGQLDIAPQVQGTVISLVRFYFFTQQQQQQVQIPVRPLSITVQPLPDAGKPPDFSGAIGQFSLNVGVSPVDVAVGDLITVSATVSGTGNMDGALPPRIIAPGFKPYEAKRIEERSNGSQTFSRQTLIPLSTNASEILSVSFSYFDPLVPSYRSISRGPFPIRFHTEAPPPEVPVYSPSPARGSSRPHSLFAIKLAPRRWERMDCRPWYSRPWLWAVQLIPLVCLLLLKVREVRRRFAGLIVALLCIAGLGHAEPVDALFRQARKAHDTGDLPGAIAAYTSILDQDSVSPELLNNMAACYAEERDFGHAALFYRRAWWMAPADPEISSGMSAVQMRTNGAPPPLPLAAWLPLLTVGQWAGAGVIAYWVLCAATAVWMLRPGARQAAAAVAAISAAALVIALAGGWQWVSVYASNEAVAIAPAEVLRLAPSTEAASFGPIQQGSILCVLETSRGWVRTATGQGTGWMPESSIEYVRPGEYSRQFQTPATVGDRGSSPH